jgi:4-aminobutyrate aminotransferase
MLEIATKRTLTKKPLLITTLPGPRAKELVERDRAVTSPYGISM